MEYRNLGKAGVKVSRVCLGTAFRGQDDEKICIQVIARAIDLGCNFIDTALYGQGRSETIVGRAIKGVREEIVLTTKVFSSIGKGPNRNGLSRLNLMRAAEDSLQRLQTDHIDLYLSVWGSEYVSMWGKNPFCEYFFPRFLACSPARLLSTERVDKIVQTLIDIGKKRGKTPAQVAVAWMLSHEEVTAPILGADLPEHVDEVFGALGWTLEPEERAALDEVSKVDELKKYA